MGATIKNGMKGGGNAIGVLITNGLNGYGKLVVEVIGAFTAIFILKSIKKEPTLVPNKLNRVLIS